MGAEVKRKEDPRLITGTSTYVGDLALPGMHYVAFVRSPHAHARIRRIDAAPALKRAGVFKVVTGNEIRKLCAALPIAGAGEGGSSDASANIGRKHYPLSVDRVRHVGEAVAAVIATSEEVAVDAAADVVVDWEPLPAVADVFQAMAKGAPQLHDDAAGNIEHQTTIKSGDPDAAFAKAKRVVKQRMVSQRLCGVPMEGRAVLAAPDPDLGRPHGVGDEPGAARPAQRPGDGARHAPEPDPGDRPGGRRRLRREVRLLPGRRDRRRARATLPHAAALDRDAARAHDGDHARPRAGHRPRGRGRGRRHHHRAPHAGDRGHRRVSDLHVHSRSHPEHGRRRLQVHERRSSVHVCLHQLDERRRVSRRRAAGSRVLPRAADRRDRGRARTGARRRAAQELHPAERVSVSGADGPALRQRRVRPRAHEGARAVGLHEAPRRAERAPAAPGPEAARHRHVLLRRDVWLRPVRERGRARGARGHRHRVHRDLGARPGARDLVLADPVRSSRRAVRQDRGAPRRHLEHPDGQRHRWQSEPGRGRLGHHGRSAQGAGEGAAPRGSHARGGRGRRRSQRRPLSGEGRARQGAHHGRDRARAPTARACPKGSSQASSRPSSSGLRPSSIRSAPTSRWSKRIATPDTSPCATSSRSTIVACASARHW